MVTVTGWVRCCSNPAAAALRASERSAHMASHLVLPHHRWGRAGHNESQSCPPTWSTPGCIRGGHAARQCQNTGRQKSRGACICVRESMAHVALPSPQPVALPTPRHTAGAGAHPTGSGRVGMSSVSFANMAVSASKPLARLMSETCNQQRRAYSVGEQLAGCTPPCPRTSAAALHLTTQVIPHHPATAP